MLNTDDSKLEAFDRSTFGVLCRYTEVQIVVLCLVLLLLTLGALNERLFIHRNF